MRDVDVIVLRQIWKTVQAITRNSDYLCSSSNSTEFKVWADDIKNSSFRDLWMTCNRTIIGKNSKPPKVNLLQHYGILKKRTLGERRWQYENV